MRITEDLAERYGGHPAVRMWHVGNEYGTHCWCDTTARHFRRWLRTRYGGLDALNEAWGTAFWSQRYDSWEEIIPPRRAQYLINPTQALDFRRFTSDALLECFTAERDVLAARTPHIPVTTNFMPLFIGQDGWARAAEEDVVSVDIYPDPADEAGLRPPLPGLPEGVEAVFRGEHLFLLNHGRTPAVVPLPSARTDLLTGRVYDAQIDLGRYAAVVLAPHDSPHPKGAAPCTERLESSS